MVRCTWWDDGWLFELILRYRGVDGVSGCPKSKKRMGAKAPVFPRHYAFRYWHRHFEYLHYLSLAGRPKCFTLALITREPTTRFSSNLHHFTTHRLLFLMVYFLSPKKAFFIIKMSNYRTIFGDFFANPWFRGSISCSNHTILFRLFTS
jgi:hypothetical protein